MRTKGFETKWSAKSAIFLRDFQVQCKWKGFYIMQSSLPTRSLDIWVNDLRFGVEDE